jgi:ketosteroid isomerase-like protein
MWMRCVRGQARTGLAFLAWCALPAVLCLRAQPTPAETGVRSVLDSQQAAWNGGDVEGFMSGYYASDSTTFVGATITRGYRQVLENYHRRYPSKEKMGHLTFSAIQVMPLGAEYASVVGKWHLDRSVEAGGEVGGFFTLLFRKTDNGWKIILDHTS